MKQNSLRRRFVVAGWNILLTFGLLVILDYALRLTPLDAARNPAIENPINYYVADDALGVQIARNYPKSDFRFRGPGHLVYSNELGCFDKSVQLDGGTPYILAIGDSFTWGYSALEKKWTSIIERQTGLRVLKCGISGTGTRNQLGHLKRLLAQLPHAPQLVIHLYDTTDFNDDFTFPGETVFNGQRIESFGVIRLRDGTREPPTDKLRAQKREMIYDGNRGFFEKRSVLYSIAKLVLLTGSRIDRREDVLNGTRPTHIKWKYEFNLLLLNESEYPYVSDRLDIHFDAVRQIRDLVLGSGSQYAIFHTNSFRLPVDRPFVRRLIAFLKSMPEFLGWMPELDRHWFDVHWDSASEARVAQVMMERLAEKNLLQLASSPHRRAETN